MPVIRSAEVPLSPANRPAWCRASSAGVFAVPRVGGRFDRHFHDCDEYWLIFSGRARVLTEGRPHYVGPGDIVCTRAGDEHDVLEVYEDLRAFWFEDAIPSGGREGHLHRATELAAGHDVPARALPEDFPQLGGMP
jgi:mannose-6-phosphate isomerase-like protein (cupin superfamily)